VKAAHTQVSTGTSPGWFRPVFADPFPQVFQLWKTLWETGNFDLHAAPRTAPEGLSYENL
jgi:hypothetical protein